MGIIARQGVKNTVITYLGTIIGAVNNIILVPVVFNARNEAEWGFAIFLLTLSVVILPFAQLSGPSIIIKYFPYFRNKSRNVLWISLGIGLIGLLISIGGVLIFEDFIFGTAKEKYIGFFELRYSLIIILFGNIIFEILAAFSKANFSSTLPIFYKEFTLRLFSTAILLTYFLDLYDFETLIFLFSINYVIQPILLFLSMYYMGIFKRKSTDKEFVSGIRRKDIINYGFFVLLSTTTAALVQRLDLIMIDKLLTNYSLIAIYNIAIYITAMIAIPGRAISNIAVPIIAESWKKNDINNISFVYRKSAVNLFIFATLIFFIIWRNFDIFLLILGPKFGIPELKLIFFFVGLAQLTNMATGVNGGIIITSEKFRYDFLLQLFLLAFTVVTNLVFIPMYGLVGVALASAISLFCYNLLKVFFVYKWFNMQPFSLSFLKAFLFSCLWFLLLEFIPHIENIYIDVIASVTIVSLYMLFIFILMPKEEISLMIIKFFREKVLKN